ncbi:MAG: J domain-containing protein [Candidatus Schekmanbacteria bacterium]|nr:J domain-containing protein [Candidatus Schekmanbacteria bacterium]
MSIPFRLARLMKMYGNAALDKVRELDLGDWEHVLDDWRDPGRKDSSTVPDREAFEDALDELEAELAEARSRRQTSKEREEPRRARPTAEPGSGPGHESSGRAGAAGRPKNDLRRHYAELNVSPDADMKTVKAAYRRLIRQHHPDIHSGDPIKEKTATERSQRLTEAYRTIEKSRREGS